MDLIIILLALGLLMFVAYRGFSVILFAPICALFAVLLTEPSYVLPFFSNIFMEKMVGFIKSYFPVFLLGAIFGKVVEMSGLAESIAKTIVRFVGAKRAILAIVLMGAILTYSGVSLFVVVFAVYPFAATLFREANIPNALDSWNYCFGSVYVYHGCLTWYTPNSKCYSNYFFQDQYISHTFTNPLVNSAITTTSLAGITGSASGGMGIALSAMADKYIEAMTKFNIPPEVMHRVIAMASGGMDTLPHNGAVITLLGVTGLTHKQSYRDIFAITVIKTLAVFFIIGLYSHWNHVKRQIACF